MESYKLPQDRVIDKFGCFVGILKYYGYFDQAAYLCSCLCKNTKQQFTKIETSLTSILAQREISIFDADTPHMVKYLNPWSKYFWFSISVKDGKTVDNLISFFQDYKLMKEQQSPVLIRLSSLNLKLDTGTVYDPYELINILATTNPEVFDYPSKITFKGRGGRGYKYTQNSRINISIQDSGGNFDIGDGVKQIFKINGIGSTPESCINFAKNGTAAAGVYSIDSSAKFDQDAELCSKIALSLIQNKTISKYASCLEFSLGSSDQFYDHITHNLLQPPYPNLTFPSLK